MNKQEAAKVEVREAMRALNDAMSCPDVGMNEVVECRVEAAYLKGFSAAIEAAARACDVLGETTAAEEIRKLAE